MSTQEIKAKVLSYKCCDWGIWTGEAKVKLLEGENKGKKITVWVVGHKKRGETITLYETTPEVLR